MGTNTTIDQHLKLYTENHLLTAGECNPEGELPLPLLMSRVIEVATGHANTWGVGYDTLVKDNQGWVLSRVTIEMKRYPRVSERYSLSTWIEDYNRHFSKRNIEISGENGETLGYVRTIWMVINFKTRESVDIGKLSYIAENILPRPCPIEPQRRLMPFEVEESTNHRFQYVDCDFNRHVNTVRYLELILNRFSLQFFDTHAVSRLEVAFIHESRFDEIATINAGGTELDRRVDIVVDNEPHVKARLVFVPR